MSKRESEFKSQFFDTLRSKCPGFYLLRYGTRAAPDWTIIGAGRQTNWEFKHATPEFTSSGDQELMCMRLAQAGHCRYVIWWETSRGTGHRTMIVHPRRVFDKSLTPEEWTEGVDHPWLVERVKRAHRL